jgi:hypothetical protein
MRICATLRHKRRLTDVRSEAGAELSMRFC